MRLNMSKKLRKTKVLATLIDFKGFRKDIDLYELLDRVYYPLPIKGITRIVINTDELPKEIVQEKIIFELDTYNKHETYNNNILITAIYREM